MLNRIKYIALVLCLVSCSMTKNIPDDEQLFTGLTKIAYEDEKEYANEAYDIIISRSVPTTMVTWAMTLAGEPLEMYYA